MEIDNASGEIINESDLARVPFLRTAYNYNADLVSQATGLITPEPTLAQQQFADEVNINTIVRNFGLTGELPKDVALPQSGDFTDATDYHTAMNLVRQAEESFALMPADIRARFANDPGNFLAFVHDDANRDEARKMGILAPEKPLPGPIPVSVVPQHPDTLPPGKTAATAPLPPATPQA